MLKRKARLYIILFVFFAAVALAAVGLVRVKKLGSFYDSLERRVSPDGMIYELISTGVNKLSLRRITKDGTVNAFHPLPDTDTLGMITAYHAIGRFGDELYLYKYDTPLNLPERHGEVIIAYNMSNGKSRVVAEVPSPASIELYDVFFAQSASGGGVFIGYLERENGSLTIIRVDAESGAVTKTFDAAVTFPLAAISVAETGELFALSRDSRVYMLDTKRWMLLFTPEPDEAAANMTVGTNGEVYLFLTSPDGSRVLESSVDDRSFKSTEIDSRGFIKLHVTSDGNWVALDDDYRYVVSSQGERFAIEKLSVSFWKIWSGTSVLIILLFALFALVLFEAARLIVTRRRLHLLAKLLIIIIPLFTLGMFILVSVAEKYVTQVTETGLRESILEYAYDTMDEIDEARFANINWNSPFDDAYFMQLHSLLSQLSGYRIMEVRGENAILTHNAYVSFWVYRIENGRVYTAIGGHHVTGLDVRSFEYSPEIPERDEMLRRRVPVSAYLGGSDSNIRWTAVLFPIIANDELVGYLEVARPLTAIDVAVFEVSRGIILSGVLVFASVVTALVLVLAFSTRTLGKLKRGALAISGGDYSARAHTRSWDETGEIAAAFNNMAQSVEKSIQDITEVSQGYSRFVSDNLIELLGKRSIGDVQAGDHKRLTATHMLLYTDRFDRLRDKAFFDALDHFYEIAIPSIASGGGLISRYSSRGLAAMFENSPEAALRSVFSIFSEIDRTGGEECHVFLSFSGAILGVSGNGEHLNMITVSPLVYESYAVGTAGKRFGIRLIVSQSAYDEMGENAARYNHRFLGIIRDEDRSGRLYDFYDCDKPEIKVKKDATKLRFENGVDCYYAGDFSKARRIFVDIIKEFPEDTASREYLKRSHAGMQSGGEPKPLIELN